jgi:shikimate kinase
MSQSRLFLVGPMGSGKSTIGRQLSNALKKEFRDSDHEIVARTGASIPLIFEIEGEEGFRKREAAMIDELTQLEGIVLATGGGAVLLEENRNNLMARGVVIYLYASVDQLFERTSRDRNRPLLQTENPRQKLQDLMEQRDPLYHEVADMVIHTDDRSIRSVVKEILVRLRQEPKYSGQ